MSVLFSSVLSLNLDALGTIRQSKTSYGSPSKIRRAFNAANIWSRHEVTAGGSYEGKVGNDVSALCFQCAELRR
jgi:hypothetical protein